MLLASRALAHAEGVEDALLGEWALSQPRLAGQSDRAAASGVTKGWRWVGEMEEIAHCMAGAGLPDGFHQAAAEIFRRCSAAARRGTRRGTHRDRTGRAGRTALPGSQSEAPAR